jgi:hypothetical protein
MKIKNKFWITVCILAFFSSARAGNHVHFILFGGFNSSKTITDFNTRQVFLSEAKQNYNFGAGFRFEFANTWFIQPEVYFTRKGGLANAFRPNSADTTFDVSMQSLDLPIMVGLRFFHSEGFCFRLYGGPVISHLKDHRLETSKYVDWGNLKASTRAFSVQVGAGLDITRRFTFDVRYEYGLSPMLKFSNYKTNHRILYFTVGLKLF